MLVDRAPPDKDNVEWRQILIAVAAIDFLSSRLRAAMAGRKSAPG